MRKPCFFDLSSAFSRATLPDVTLCVSEVSESLELERAASMALRQELEQTRNDLKIALAKLNALQKVLDDRNNRISGQRNQILSRSRESDGAETLKPKP
jgi:hypothetical protein